MTKSVGKVSPTPVHRPVCKIGWKPISLNGSNGRLAIRGWWKALLRQIPDLGARPTATFLTIHKTLVLTHMVCMMYTLVTYMYWGVNL